MRAFLEEFKTFIKKGNVFDMAVGVVIGAAFTAIVNSLVKDIINPLMSFLTGGVDFGYLTLVLKEATENSPEVAIRYGMFINAIINFIIISFALFLFVRSFNKMKEIAERDDIEEAKEKAEAEKKALEEAEANKPEPPKPADIVLLEEIRDLLKK